MFDLGSWVIGLLAESGRKKLVTLVLGTEQERALRSVAAAAIKMTAQDFHPDDDEQADQLALVIGQVFDKPVPNNLFGEQPTILDALQIGLGGQLAVLDDATLTGQDQSPAELLGVSATSLTKSLITHLVQEIITRASRGGPLVPLAAQLNHDATHIQGRETYLQGQQIYDAVLQLVATVQQTPRHSGTRAAAQPSTQPMNRTELADAVLTGPARTVGADRYLSEAARLENDDPAAAAREILAAEQLLTANGFDAHATVLTRRRADLLAAAGDYVGATTLLSDRFWRALDDCDTDEARRLSHLLAKVASAGGLSLHDALAEAALDVVRNTLQLPRIDLVRFDNESVRPEFARLVLFMAQTAAIDPASTWAHDNVDRIMAAADALDRVHTDEADNTPDIRLLTYRLRIETADVTGDWATLLQTARRHQVDRQICGLILARHAMHHADRGMFDAADQSWESAIDEACLDGRNALAAEWVHSRRILYTRLRGLSSDPEAAPALVRSLLALSNQHGQPAIDRLKTRALDDMADQKWHQAATNWWAFLRIAHATGSWGQVIEGRERLASVYEAVSEHGRAVAQLILAGAAQQAARVATAASDRFIDIRDSLSGRSYWVAASAFSALSAQADLVPDEHVGQVADTALEVLRRSSVGELQDSPFFAPSLAAAAVHAVSMLSRRLTTEQATILLDYLRPLVPRRDNTYRFTDEDHVRACMDIAATNALLRDEAFAQLLGLLAATTSHVSTVVGKEASALFTQYADAVHDRIAAMAVQGNRSAAGVLARMATEPTDNQLAAAEAAAQRLSTPSDNTATSIGTGTDATAQSLLARCLPAPDRKALVQAQLDRAASAYEPGDNRAEYYLAAANLAHDLTDVDDLFDEAMRRAVDQTPSPGDLLTQIGSHPLGTFRITGFTVDTRPQATLLAARLARTLTQRNRVRAHAISLLGVDAGYYCVRALQVLDPDDLVNDVPFLAVHQDWAARSLAAITWTQSSPDDPTIGLVLAGDHDQRVRRALAQGVACAPRSEPIDTVAAKLADDPRFSIRVYLQRNDPHK